ncbi:unnamed protein product, partial [Vitis vinifera]|uniref:Uncharacterized protein n=1 Tax=Vitis vinifera TaxID=29760 RepID=D7TNK7_VITVI
MLYHWDWESTISSSKVGNENNYLPVDCVIKEGPNSFHPSDSILTMVGSGLKDDLVLGILIYLDLYYGVVN